MTKSDKNGKYYLVYYSKNVQFIEELLEILQKVTKLKLFAHSNSGLSSKVCHLVSIKVVCGTANEGLDPTPPSL